MTTNTFIPAATLFTSAAALFTCIAVAAACLTFTGPAQAKDKDNEVTVSLSVSGADLDVDQPAGASALYGRLQHAANIVCGPGNRVGLVPVANFRSCYEKAVGDAIRRANRPQLTAIYLQTHTLHDAATHHIDVPFLVAAK